MIAKAVTYFSTVSPRMRRFIWRHAYQALNKKFSDINWYFLNYGYRSLESNEPLLPLKEEDEDDRDFIQLYHHVAQAAELEGKDVLEVGSGRGGGSSYMARYLTPRSLIGVDRSEQAVAFCKKVHRSPNLEYRVGDAEALPFQSQSFDAVVNIESSHCYGSMEKFLREVRRVLRPDGCFVWADFREKNQKTVLDEAFGKASLRPFKKEDITPNVLVSLDRMHERKVRAIHQHVPKPFIPSLLEFAGIQGSAIYDSLQSREKVYWHYACR